MKAIKTSKKAQRRADKGLIRDAVANKGDARRQLLARLGHLVAGAPSRVEGGHNLRVGQVVTLTDADGTSRTMVVVDERGGLAPFEPEQPKRVKLPPLPPDDDDPEYRPIVVSARQASDLMRLGITDGYVVAEPAR